MKTPMRGREKKIPDIITYLIHISLLINVAIPNDAAFYVGKYGYLNKDASSYALNRINYLRLYNNELSQSDILAYYNSNT